MRRAGSGGIQGPQELWLESIPNLKKNVFLLPYADSCTPTIFPEP